MRPDPIETHPGAPPRRTRRRGIRIRALILLAVLVVAVGGVAIAGSAATNSASKLKNDVTSQILAGQNEMDAGKTALLKANSDHNVAELATARSHFEAANADFSNASKAIKGSVLVSVAGNISSIATSVHAAQAIADMGIALSRAALDAVDLNQMFLKPASGSGASAMVTVMRQSHGTVVRMRDEFISAQNAAKSVDASALTQSQAAQLAKAKDSITKGLSGLNDLLQLLPAALEILGGNGSRTYLVEQVDPAELRAGGGFIGTYSILGADNGKLSLVKTGPIDSVDYPRVHYPQPGYVAPPSPMQEFIGLKSWVLGDSNFYPDFATNAAAGEMFALKEIGYKTDGVISIDPYTIADLLEVTGPIAIPEFNTTVQAKGFVSDLFQREEYVTRQLNRKEFIGLVATRLFEKISTLPSDKWQALITALNNAASTRHLQVYFNNPIAESEMKLYGWSGTMNPQKMPNFFYEVESNFGATKANYFLQRNYDVHVTRTSSGLHITVHIAYKNPTPAGYNGGRLYRCYVRFYVPQAATNLKVGFAGPNKDPDTSVPADYKLMDGWFQSNVNLALGYGLFEVQFDYDMPWSPASDGTEKIYWQKQPGTLDDGIRVTWTVAGHTYTTTSKLSTDRLITLGPTSVAIEPGQAGSAHLPSISF